MALIARDGSVYGGTVTVDPKVGTYTLPLTQLKPVKFVSLPRPYPSFLPYFINTIATTNSVDLSTVESVQLSIEPGIAPGQQNEKHGIAIISVTLNQ